MTLTSKTFAPAGCTCRAFALAALAAATLAAPAQADGTFVQIDQSDIGTDAVLSVGRDPLTFSGNFSDYEGGSTAGAAVTYGVPLGNLGTLKVGPTLGKSFGGDATGLKLGAKAGFETYQATDFGHIFFLGELNSIESGWFTSLQAGLGGGFGVELSAGGNDNYDAVNLAASQKLGNSPMALRGGYRFTDEEFFLGVTVNTF